MIHDTGTEGLRTPCNIYKDPLSIMTKRPIVDTTGHRDRTPRGEMPKRRCKGLQKAV